MRVASHRGDIVPALERPALIVLPELEVVADSMHQALADIPTVSAGTLASSMVGHACVIGFASVICFSQANEGIMSMALKGFPGASHPCRILNHQCQRQDAVVRAIRVGRQPAFTCEPADSMYMWLQYPPAQDADDAPLGLVMIVKDEAQSINVTMASARAHVDYWTLADTGSTDGTQDIIKDVMSPVPGGVRCFGVWGGRVSCVVLQFNIEVGGEAPHIQSPGVFGMS